MPGELSFECKKLSVVALARDQGQINIKHATVSQTIISWIDPKGMTTLHRKLLNLFTLLLLYSNEIGTFNFIQYDWEEIDIIDIDKDQ